ncbi:MAG TPA: hypothetical protein VNY31_01015 [Solirubrobacteraceae bacterium]|nr:hypothetical protein [Solirubrobacteraceae bacterium]
MLVEVRVRVTATELSTIGADSLCAPALILSVDTLVKLPLLAQATLTLLEPFDPITRHPLASGYTLIIEQSPRGSQTLTAVATDTQLGSQLTTALLPEALTLGTV